jgi:hypothetical protein
MNSTLIFWPVLAQVVLTILVFILMGLRKAKSIKAGTVNRKEAALDNRVWPTDVVQVSNNIANQFETPILFYVLCIVLYISGGVGVVALVLAWAYSLSRYAHAFVHTGSNFVPTRMRIFLFGIFVLLLMILLAGFELASGGVSQAESYIGA